MTRLLSDLTNLASLHGHQHADALVLVPIGMVRAAVTMLGRYEGFPLMDRDIKPEWLTTTVPEAKGRGRHRAEGRR